MAVLDKLTECLETVKIQRCKCGSLVIFFYGHIMQHHHELINPDGTIRENAIVELQDTRTNGQLSNHQEVSDKASTRINQVTQGTEHVRAAKPTQNENCEQRYKNSEISGPERSNRLEMPGKASTKTDQVAQDKEHIRAGRPGQDMNCGQKSDHREITNPETSNPREVAESATIRVNQEVPVESTASAETKQDAALAPEGDEDDAADGTTTDLQKPTDENPDSKGPEETGVNKNDEKHDIL